MTSGRIVLTRDHAGNEEWGRALTAQGLGWYSLPCIQTVPAPVATIEQPLLALDDADWLTFTSPAGVRHTAALLDQLGIARPSLGRCRIAAVGDKTAQAVRSLGLEAAFLPPQASATDLARQLPGVTGRRVVLLRSAIALPRPVEILRLRGAHVTDVPVYHTQLITTPDPVFEGLVRRRQVSALVFASPSAGRGFISRLPDDVLRVALAVPAVSIGPSVTQALAAAGFTSIRTTHRPTVQDVISMIR